MPKTIKKEFRYQCREVACRKLIRGEKWLVHCKSDHGYKFARGSEIQKITVAVRSSGGNWLPTTDQSHSQVCK